MNVFFLIFPYKNRDFHKIRKVIIFTTYNLKRKEKKSCNKLK